MGSGLSIEVIVKVSSVERRSTQHPIVGYPVFWINLDRSVDRRRRMQSALDAAGIVATRVPAVDGKRFDPLDRVDRITLPPANCNYVYPRFLVEAFSVLELHGYDR